MIQRKIGDKVVLLVDFGEYPMPAVPAGSTGEIVEITNEFVGVKMDVDFPHLADWENVLQVYTFDDDGGQRPDWDAIGTPLKPNRQPFVMNEHRRELLIKACEVAAAAEAPHTRDWAAFRVLAEKLRDGDTLTPDAR